VSRLNREISIGFGKDLVEEILIFVIDGIDA
jgi:hypothetical protein